MSGVPRAFAVVGLAVVAGCRSRGELLASEEGGAIQMTVHRGQSEFGCQKATGTVLSSNILQAVPWGGQAQVEYTIDVSSGCGKHSVYVVICPLGLSGCFVGAVDENPATRNHLWILMGMIAVSFGVDLVYRGITGRWIHLVREAGGHGTRALTPGFVNDADL